MPRYVTRPLPLIAALLAVAACERAPQGENLARVDGVTTGGLRGTALAQPLEKPTFVLPRTDGRPYDFARETDGKVTLLFFGYTHCPDVCPLHMANIAAVLKKLPWGTRDMIRVVFVTTDPERDTPERLAQWLGDFDPTFIGLRGEPALLDSIQRSLGIVPATRQGGAAGADSAEYLVGHAAQVFAFGRDNVARVVYPFGTRQEDWAHDLPRLVAPTSDQEERVATAQVTSGSLGSRADLAIAPPVVATPADGRSAALYLNVLNAQAHPDTLRSVSIIGGGVASLHITRTENGVARMQPVAWIEIPAGERLEMRPGGTHVMLEAAAHPFRPGTAAAVELYFSGRGRVTALATVVSYAQLDSVLTLARASLAR